MGTVPTLCILDVGTVPTLCILNVGIVPTFSSSLNFIYRKDTNTYFCLEKYLIPGQTLITQYWNTEDNGTYFMN